MSTFINKLTHHNAQPTTVDSFSNGISSDYHTVNNPVSVQTIVGAPIIEEHIRNDRVLEIQPVIHREVDHNVVHHIERHIQEAPAPTQGGVYEKNAIVQQNYHTNVVNEIQPIIHRERVVAVAERVEQHHMERVTEATIHTHEVTYENAPSSYYTQSTSQPKSHGLFHRH